MTEASHKDDNKNRQVKNTADKQHVDDRLRDINTKEAPTQKTPDINLLKKCILTKEAPTKGTERKNNKNAPGR